MNVNDYSTKVAAARDRYNDAATKLREDYQSNKEMEEARHQMVEKKQAANYAKSVAEKEQDLGKLSEDYSAKTQEEIQKRQERFQSELGTRREAYEEETGRLREKLGGRLEEIKEQYDGISHARERTHDGVISDMEDRHKRAQKQLAGAFNEQVTGLQEKSSNAIRDLAEKEAKDKREILAKHDKEFQEQVLGHNQSTSRIHSKHGQMMESVRAVHDSEKQSMMDYHEGLNDSIRKSNAEQTSQMRQNFENLTDNLGQRNKNEQDKLIAENKNTIRGMEDKFDKDMHNLNRRTNAVLNGSDHGDGARNELLRERAANDKRTETLKGNMNEMRMADKMSREQADRMGKEAMRAQNLAALETRDKLEKEHNDFNRDVIGKVRKDRDGAVEQYSKQLYDLKKETEAKLIHERNQNNKVMSTQRAEFAKSVNQMTDKNLQASKEMRQANAEATKNMVEANRKNTFNEREELKDVLGQKLAKTTESYEQRLDGKEKHIDGLTNFYENKVSTLGKKSAAEINKLKEMEEQRRMDEERTAKREAEAREQQHALEMKSIRDFVADTIDKTKSDYDARMNRLTQNYEDQLMRERQEHDKETDMKLGEARENYERLAKASQMQLEAQRAQYENKIEKMRQTTNANLEILARRQARADKA